MEQKWTLLAGLVIIGLPLLMSFYASDPGKDPGEHSVNASFYTSGEKVSWAILEVADSQAERREGLMNRTQLGKRSGMLFVFENEDIRSFWMKNTYIPLDIIFLDGNKTVINVEDARPQPNVSDGELERYKSDAPAKYVVEVREGFAENFSVSPGSKISWEK